MKRKELVEEAARTVIAAVSSAVAAVAVRKRVKSLLKEREAAHLLDEFQKQCELSESKLTAIAEGIAAEMHAGLEADGVSSIKMLPTYIYNPPQGIETGFFYGLDFGGTYYRSVVIELRGQSSPGLVVSSEKHLIPDYVKRGTSEKVFDFIAQKLSTFIESVGELSSSPIATRLELGFSFSFPVKQKTLSTANLIEWTKGFAVEDGVGRDVGGCLQHSMSKTGIYLRVAFLANDTVSTFCFGRYQNQDTVAAVVIGTGTNASYMEKVTAIPKCNRLLATSDEMVINLEWGNFQSADLPKTSYDMDLDVESLNPNQQGFEKMISGLYLGDIVRRVVLRLSAELDMETISDKLRTPFTLSTESVAQMNEDTSPNLDMVAQVFGDTLEMPEVPLTFRRWVVAVCDIVTRRAAGLVAAGIAGILMKRGRSDSGEEAKRRRPVIVMGGGVYHGYYLFRKYLDEAVAKIVGEVTILRSEDSGPVIGAALLAASRSPITPQSGAA